MALLKEGLVEAGFADVRTYINSGNVLFSSHIDNRETLAQMCSQVIAESFGIAVAVAVISPEELASALDNAPPWWGINEQEVHNAIFVIAPLRTDEVFASLSEHGCENGQRVAYYQNVLFWSMPKESFLKGRGAKITNSTVSKGITVRSANTARKLLALAQE